MIPIFSPQKGAYRLGDRTFEGSFNTGATGAFYWTPTGDRVYYGTTISNTSSFATVGYRDASTNFDISTLGAASSASFKRSVSVNANPSFDDCLIYLDGGAKLIASHRESGGDVVILQYDSLSPAYIDDGSVEAWTNRYEDTGSTLGVNARNLIFNSDGTEANYAVGQEIYNATLSTGYDVSTIGAWSSIRDFTADIGTEAIYAQCFGRSNKNYFIGTDADVVYEYRLSTGGDISTASFVTSHDLSGDFPATIGQISAMSFVDGGRRFIASRAGLLFSWSTEA